jgi:hypothetical protein
MKNTNKWKKVDKASNRQAHKKRKSKWTRICINYSGQENVNKKKQLYFYSFDLQKLKSLKISA